MRRKAGTSTKKNKAKKGSALRKNEAASLDELLPAADAAMTGLDVAKAIALLSQAATLLRKGQSRSVQTREQDLIQVLEKLGEWKVSEGDQEGAKANFQEALSLLEGENREDVAYYESVSSLYFYIGQLCMDHEALQVYQKGIQSLESSLQLAQQTTSQDMEEEGAESTPTITIELQRKLSGAYCTVSELYLTDLCYDENAESECEKYLEMALKINDVDGEPHVDALQIMASLRLSQQSRRCDAVPYALRGYEKIKTGCEALATLVGLAEKNGDMATEEQASELTEVEAASNLPEFEFRCQTAKILLECAALLKETEDSQSTDEDRCVAAAISVLGSLLAQNDEVVEIWFLTGCAFATRSSDLAESAKFYLDRAMEMLLDLKKGLEQELQFADEDREEIQAQLEDNQKQIEEVQTKLNDIGGEDGSNMEE